MESPGKLSKVPCKTLDFHTPRKHLKPGTALELSMLFWKTLNFMDSPRKPSNPGTVLELSLLYRKPGITCIVLENLICVVLENLDFLRFSWETFNTSPCPLITCDVL